MMANEPDAAEIIKAGRKRSTQTVEPQPAIQPVTLQSKPEPEVSVDDPQVKNLVQTTGMSAEEAWKLVTDLKRMWG